MYHKERKDPESRIENLVGRPGIGICKHFDRMKYESALPARSLSLIINGVSPSLHLRFMLEQESDDLIELSPFIQRGKVAHDHTSAPRHVSASAGGTLSMVPE